MDLVFTANRIKMAFKIVTEGKEEEKKRVK